MRIPLATLAALLSIGLLAAPALADDGDASRRDRRTERRARLLEQYDRDGDGKLGAEERDAARAAKRAEVLRKHDANGDGTLDRDERRAARSKRRAEGGDEDRARRPRRAQRRRVRQRVRRRVAARMLDTNGDGRLDDAERAKAREAFERRLAKFGERAAERRERAGADGDRRRDGRRRARRFRAR